MITILFVVDTLEVGGTEQSLLELVRRLPRDQFRCVVCALYPGRTLVKQFVASDVEVVCLDLPGKYRFPTAIRRLSAVVKRVMPDLIHTMLFRASQVGRISGWRNGVPVISSFVNVPYDRSRRMVDKASHGWKLKGLQCMDAITARLVSRFHSVSEFAKKSNCQALRVDVARVAVIPRGRDPLQFPARELPACRPAAPMVMNVGRLIEQKGQVHLITAMQNVTRQVPEAKLQIAGDGPLRESLAVLVRQLGLDKHVELLGRCLDVPEQLKAADVFAFPSLYEGLPGALIEAMFAGCPIVAADIPQIRELIQHEVSGLLVPPGDAQCLGTGICRLLQNSELASRLGAEARRIALLKYDIRVVTRQMGDFYDRVISDYALRGGK